MSRLEILKASLKSHVILIKYSPETQGWRFKEIRKIKELINRELLNEESIQQNNATIELDTTVILVNVA